MGLGWQLDLLRERMLRLKTLSADLLQSSKLSRCLSTFDITVLGIGHMIGAGIYVLTGPVMKNIAGPGIIFSFLLAGMASILSAFCYAEFGSRVPMAGSAYSYTYVTVGEIWAFVIGWNIILEHMLCAAAVARSWSGYLNSLFGNVIRESLPFGASSASGGLELSSFFSFYPDPIALIVVLLVAAFMASGAKISTRFNSVLTVVNCCVIVFVVIVGFSFADLENWKSPNGFLPYGVAGVMSGAASCFFAYIGFEGLTTASEEALDPSKSIPVALFVSMAIVSACYVMMSTSLSLMVPYSLVDARAPFSTAFDQIGLHWAKYVVAIGALSGMITSLVGSLFALPRCVYAMAKDGLIFRALGKVNEKTQAPVNAIIFFGILTSLIALLFEIETLVEFLSIGTLMAYTIVSASVIILRYQPISALPEAVLSADEFKTDVDGDLESTCDKLPLDTADKLAGRPKDTIYLPSSIQSFLKSLNPGVAVLYAVFGLVMFMFAFFFFLTVGPRLGPKSLSDIFAVVSAILSVICLGLIFSHHQNRFPLQFRVPLVPLVPFLSITINLGLMLHLGWMTWIRLVIWLTVGFLIYFCYGIRESNENVSVVNKDVSYETMSKTSVISADVEPSVTVEKQQPKE